MENQRTQLKVAMYYGLLYGLSGVASFLLFYFIKTDLQSKLPQLAGYMLLVIFIIIGVKSYRDEDLGGYISYGKSLGTGILIAIFGGVITGAFTVIMFNIIDPSLTQKIIDAAQQSMAEKGLTEEQMETGMSYTTKFITPFWLFTFSVLGSAFMGFLFSLLISIFVRKESNPFNSNLGQ